jgi:brefeldin A-inhibited guanine nucleotide-exchange protein
MLNTDAHNPQIKPQNKMTKPQFFRNTSGINDGADIPEEVVSSIYDDILGNEIRMKDEMEAALPAAGAGLANAFVNVGRDLQKEAYVVQTSNMANKTEVGNRHSSSEKLSHLWVGIVQIPNAVATKGTTRPTVL